jgi:hypothetical protein
MGEICSHKGAAGSREQGDVLCRPDVGREQENVMCRPDVGREQENVMCRPDVDREQDNVMCRPDVGREQENVMCRPDVVVLLTAAVVPDWTGMGIQCTAGSAIMTTAAVHDMCSYALLTVTVHLAFAATINHVRWPFHATKHAKHNLMMVIATTASTTHEHPYAWKEASAPPLAHLPHLLTSTRSKTDPKPPPAQDRR